MESNLPAVPAHPLRIFLVENHPDTLKYLQLYIESMGHATVAAHSMQEAVRKLPAADCDMLISDIGLPDGDGWELLRQVRGRLPKPIYAVAMSGFGLTTDCRRSAEAGYHHHLLKPFKPVELDALIREAAQERLVPA